MFSKEVTEMISFGLLETLYMTLTATALAYVIGLPLGVALVVSEGSDSSFVKGINTILGILVNLLRSVPFLILLVALIPFTRLVVGTSIGSTATIVPLVIASAPFIARLVESSIKEVDRGVIEAAQCMGAPMSKIIYKVMLPEAKPSLI
nr:ABC transporter permease subunit [Bacillota bacterium]